MGNDGNAPYQLDWTDPATIEFHTAWARQLYDRIAHRFFPSFEQYEWAMFNGQTSGPHVELFFWEMLARVVESHQKETRGVGRMYEIYVHIGDGMRADPESKMREVVDSLIAEGYCGE